MRSRKNGTVVDDNRMGGHLKLAYGSGGIKPGWSNAEPGVD